jgi:hypothetical protein
MATDDRQYSPDKVKEIMEAGFKQDRDDFDKRIWAMERKLASNPNALTPDKKDLFTKIKKSWAAEKATNFPGQPETTEGKYLAGVSLEGALRFVEGRPPIGTQSNQPMSTTTKVASGAAVLAVGYGLFRWFRK